MERKGSRRSFIAEVFTRVAGGWVAVAGLVGLSSMLGGCGDDTNAPKYGTLPYEGGVKYGIDVGPVVKYGPLFDGGASEGPAPKYGIKVDGGNKG